MPTEKKTDLLVYSLMTAANLDPQPERTSICEVQEALKTASKRLTGKAGRPEYIAVSDDFLLIVEDKKNPEYQACYMPEKPDTLLMDTKSVTEYAENGALHYAQHITAMTNFKKVFAFGCSGTDKDSLIIRPIFVSDKNYKVMPRVRTFQDFAPTSIRDYYKSKVLEGKTERQMELESILDRAKQLHEDLRNYGSLSEDEKPIVVSGLLLALCKHGFSTSDLTCGRGSNKEERRSDGEKIYEAIEQHVRHEVEAMPDEKVNRLLNQFQVIHLRPNLSERNPRLAKSPLKYFAEYIKSKVLTAIQNNTPEDVLGRFYGEFLSYSAGDGKGLGIVLTPSHITQLMCDLIDVRYTDNVFDSTCGTGGFLIAAMSRMLSQIDALPKLRAEREAMKLDVKRKHLHGIEMNEKMFAIATTNMILRGDGKSNLQCQNFLTTPVNEIRDAHFTVGLMNPPYSQAKNKKTAHLSELHFIRHLLDGMDDFARVAVIVPQSAMVGKTADDRRQKTYILRDHTLEGVITCNPQTFYPVGTNPVIAVFTAHQPHPERKRCKFIDFKKDGYVLYPHIGMLDDGTHEEKVKHLLECWHDFVSPDKIPSSFMVRSTVSAKDEWLHSYYYFNDEPPTEEDFRNAMADYLSFEFKMIVSGRGYLFGIKENDKEEKPYGEHFENNDSQLNLAAEPLGMAAKQPADNAGGKEEVRMKRFEDIKWKAFRIIELFNDLRGNQNNMKSLLQGEMPLISAKNDGNGYKGFVKESESSNPFPGNCITLNNDGDGGAGLAYYQPHEMYVDSHVTALYPKEYMSKYAMLFIAKSLSKQRILFGHGHSISNSRLHGLSILLPSTPSVSPDYAFMEQYMRSIERQLLDRYRKFIETKNEAD